MNSIKLIYSNLQATIPTSMKYSCSSKTLIKEKTKLSKKSEGVAKKSF